MLPQESIPDLSDIAKRMVGAGYKTECCQVYVSIRKAILEESLSRLGYEKLSIEEVLKITWNILENDIEKWLHSFKVAVGVIFASEKRFCDQVFAFMASVLESCFAELAKGAMTQLLTFAEAIAIGRRSPEKLFKILDMYERLRDDLPDIESIFAGAACASVGAEASGILTRLGEAARGTFGEFENAVQRDSSKNHVPGGAVHPLTKYEMNYVKFLSDYKDTLNNLLSVRRNEDNREMKPPKLLWVVSSLKRYARCEIDWSWSLHFCCLCCRPSFSDERCCGVLLDECKAASMI